MRFWTAYQEPLLQAAKVEEGEVTLEIPNHPAKTPARWVAAVGEHKGDLLIGRQASVDIWKMDGSLRIGSIYHPWIYALHVVGSYAEHILVASGIGVCFLMDEDGNTKWAWWAYKDGYGEEPKLIHEKDWKIKQITGSAQFSNKLPYLNSASVDNNGIIVSFLNSNKVLILDPNETNSKSREIATLPVKAMHDFKYDYRLGRPVLVGGVQDGLFIDGKVYAVPTGYGDAGKFIKRVTLYEDDKYLVTHETGVTVMDRSGRVLSNIALPRPFNTVVF